MSKAELQAAIDALIAIATMSEDDSWVDDRHFAAEVMVNTAKRALIKLDAWKPSAPPNAGQTCWWCGTGSRSIDNLYCSHSCAKEARFLD